MVSALAPRAGAVSSGGAPHEWAPATNGAKIELSGVTKRFVTPSGSVFTAIGEVDLVIEPGQFCAIVGPTGCGKSTTLARIWVESCRLRLTSGYFPRFEDTPLRREQNAQNPRKCSLVGQPAQALSSRPAGPYLGGAPRDRGASD